MLDFYFIFFKSPYQSHRQYYNQSVIVGGHERKEANCKLTTSTSFEEQLNIQFHATVYVETVNISSKRPNRRENGKAFARSPGYHEFDSDQSSVASSQREQNRPQEQSMRCGRLVTSFKYIL